MYSKSILKNWLIIYPFLFLTFLFISGNCLGQNFITKWNLATAGSGATTLSFGTATAGTVSYSWQEVSPGTASGSGTFSGSTLSITGLPAGKTIRLQIVPTNFKRIIINSGANCNRLVDVEQWGSTVWTSMANAFYGCSNMQVSATDVPVLSACTDLSNMFRVCGILNSPTNIGTWNVSSVTNMSGMFFGATAFNQDIGAWNVGAVTNMSLMFLASSAFNQNIGTWNVSAVTNMSAMFASATSFNQNIGTWNVSAVTNMSDMFNTATTFNQNIGAWNVSAVTNMTYIFSKATSFNQNISTWNVGAVTSMLGMFNQALAFNQNIGNWNVGAVTNMQAMFEFASAFNQNIGAWNVSAVTNMSLMFHWAIAFNQSLAPWAIKLNVGVNLDTYLDYSGLSTANYDSTLIAFDASAPNGRTMGADGLKYCAGTAARAHLIGSKGWTISGDVSGALPGNCLTCINGAIVNSSVTWYLNADGDGYAKLIKDTCASPGIGYTNTVLPLGDCNDNNATIHPGAPDTNCNGIDENCSGTADEGYVVANCLTCVTGAVVNSSMTWYLNVDGDGYAASSMVACTSPGTGYTTTVLPLGDCNDSNPAIHPGALDNNCNGVDENCSGTADEGYVAANCLSCQSGSFINNASPDYVTLKALYRATDGAHWTHTWDTTDCTIDDWYGVTTNVNGRVIFLFLNNNGLNGSLPSELGNLSNLLNLSLSRNQLIGIIPGQLGNLTNLQSLYLDGNELTGPIPSQLGNLSHLMQLNLNQNQLTGNIPVEIGNLSNLYDLYLGYNQLSGSIPTSLGNLSSLQNFYLYSNQLSGTIPSQLGNLSNLISLSISENQLTGSIPAQLGNLTNLQYLLLYINQLSGSIPSQLGNLTNLKYLDLDGNQLSGTIPNQLGNLFSLQTLNLSYNQLSGCFSSNLLNLCSHLINYDLSNNSGLPGGGDFASFCANGTGTVSTWYLDADHDGHAIKTKDTCSSPGSNYTSTVLPIDDCNDTVTSIHPGAIDNTCDGIDQDCDGLIDEDAPIFTYYRDADNDGFGNLAIHKDSCALPTGYVLNSTDCNDAVFSIHPGAADNTCDGIDQDCDGFIDEDATLSTYYRDADGDTYGNFSITKDSCAQPVGYTLNHTDCNDSNASIHPNAADNACDGIDQDCDGLIDEDAMVFTYYRDADGDGFGNLDIHKDSCSTPLGYVLNSTDCNDAVFSIHPGAVDNTCDGIDQDCDSSIDEDAPVFTYFRDADGDGFGNLAIHKDSCALPLGYVLNITDCNDAVFSIHPGAADNTCDGIDQDCDGFIDEDATLTTYYRDADGDTYGNFSITKDSCAQPVGYTLNHTDCNDSNASIHPSAVDNTCDGIDQDCDGFIDEDATLTTYYRDADGDTYGNFSITKDSCAQPVGYTLNHTDCNDNSASIHPNAVDNTCDGIDQDCDGSIDEEATLTTYYRDADGDTYGNSAIHKDSCVQPVGYTLNHTDCNDNNASIHPNAFDNTCDGIDQDCDGSIDEEATLTTYYLDADGDTYGNLAIHKDSCAQPTGYVLNHTDCNDNSTSIHPGAADNTCDGIDQDCDGSIDKDAAETTYYRDADGDTYGNSAIHKDSCAQPPGYVLNHTDCNDSNASIHPNAADNTCDGIDQDCDGLIDEDAHVFTYYRDADGDGFGNVAIHKDSCSTPIGYVLNSTDCNDAVSSIHPGAVDNTCDGIDQDCDVFIDEDASVFTYYRDADSDGFGALAIHKDSCATPLGYVLNSTDCNDAVSSIHPGAADNTCDGIDEDCDGSIDEDVTLTTYYRDADGDTYGNSAIHKDSCAQPAGFTLNHTDCNDSNASIHPNAADNTCDGIDQDCDGFIDEDATQTTYYKDADGDTYGNSAIHKDSCAQPAGFTLNHTDCNDSNASIHPNAADNTCDGIDQDCDGSIDEDATLTTYYRDADGDTYGNSAIHKDSCAQPAGFTLNHTDCNDSNASIHPNAADNTCDGIDQDCDGSMDEDATPTRYYKDTDGDTYGNLSIHKDSCAQPTGYVLNHTDCNDNIASIHPGVADNTCDGFDQDCDGFIDEDAGVPLTPTFSFIQPTCTLPAGTITVTNKAALDSESFNNGVSYQISNVKSGLTPGTYIVLIKTTAGCNSISSSAVINSVPATPSTPTFTLIQPTCALPTGTITVTNKAALDSVSFNNGVSYQISNVKSGLTPGTYIELIKTAAGCISISASAVINIVPGPATPLLSLIQPTCPLPTGTITVTNKAALDSASFNNGLSYQISNVKSGLTTGTYVVKIKTASGCISSTVNAVLLPASLMVTINNLDTAYFRSDPAFILGGTPTGGEFRIDGNLTLANLFSPLLLTDGNHTVTYKVVQATCNITITKQVKIKLPLVPNDPNQCYTIENYVPLINPLFPILVAGTSVNNIVQQSSTGTLNQKWTFENVSGFFRIKNKASSAYLRFNGANIVQGTFASPASEWTLEQNITLGGTFNIKHRSGNYLTANTNGTYQLAPLTGALSLNQNFNLRFTNCIATSALLETPLPVELRAKPLSILEKQVSVELYPNPGKGLFTIQVNDLNVNSNSRLIIYSVIGNKIWSKKLNTIEPISVTLEEHVAPNGLYILVLKTPTQTLEKRFIIQR